MCIRDSFQIIARTIRCSTDTLDGLRNKGSNLSGRRVANDPENVLGAFRGDLFRSSTEWTAVWIGMHGVMNANSTRNRKLPGIVRREAHRARRAAMISVAQGDDVGIAGIEARHGNGEIVRFASIVHEVCD